MIVFTLLQVVANEKVRCSIFKRDGAVAAVRTPPKSDTNNRSITAFFDRKFGVWRRTWTAKKPPAHKFVLH